jgi:hypothetical protein
MLEPTPVKKALAELVILGLVEVIPGTDPPVYRAVAQGRCPWPKPALHLGMGPPSGAKNGWLNGNREDEGDGEEGLSDAW